MGDPTVPWRAIRPESTWYSCPRCASARSTWWSHWMRVGFVHGVMNTDNMSMLGPDHRLRPLRLARRLRPRLDAEHHRRREPPVSLRPAAADRPLEPAPAGQGARSPRSTPSTRCRKALHRSGRVHRGRRRANDRPPSSAFPSTPPHATTATSCRARTSCWASVETDMTIFDPGLATLDSRTGSRRLSAPTSTTTSPTSGTPTTDPSISTSDTFVAPRRLAP